MPFDANGNPTLFIPTTDTTDDPKAGAYVRVDMLTRLLGPVGSVGKIPQGTTTITALDGHNGIVGASTATVTFGQAFELVYDVPDLTLEWWNAGAYGGGDGGGDTVHANSFSISAGIEVSANGTDFTGSIRIPLTLDGGQVSRTFTGGLAGFIRNDPVAAKAGLYRVYTAVTPTTRTDSFPTNFQQFGGNNGGLDTLNPGDLTASGTVSNTDWNDLAYGPSAILGTVLVPTKTRLSLVTDSIGDGTGDDANYGGWIMRGLSGNLRGWRSGGYGIAGLRKQGSSFANLVTRTIGKFRQRYLGLGAETVLYALGTNELGSALATIQANAILAARIAKLRGAKRVLICTLIPNTNAGNTAVGANEAKRTGFNAWVRGGISAATGGLIDGVIDGAKYAEGTGGLFRTDLGTPTSDGIHPNAVIHQAMSAAIPEAAAAGLLS